jgi:hypothetical protein
MTTLPSSACHQNAISRLPPRCSQHHNACYAASLRWTRVIRDTKESQRAAVGERERELRARQRGICMYVKGIFMCPLGVHIYERKREVYVCM